MMRSNMGQQQQLMQPRMEMMGELKIQSSLRMSPIMRSMYRADQTMSPNQYFLQDKFGNYAYAYANQNSEKMEEGDQNSVKGHYAYIMSNGQKRRVDYIADNQGFHVIRDDAYTAGRLKRSVEPDLIQTKMTSYMDSSSLRDDSRNHMTPNNMMHINNMGMMDNQMGRNMYRNTMNNGMSSQMVNRNMMTQDMNRNMMNQNMMGQDISNNRMYSNMLSQNMPNNMMNMNSRDMMSKNMNSRDMMSYNMMNSRDMTSNNMFNSRDMMSNNMMNSRDMMSYNMMNNQMMGQDMMRDNMNMMNQGMNRMNSYANNERMGQNRNIMSQRMEIEQIPSARLF